MTLSQMNSVWNANSKTARSEIGYLTNLLMDSPAFICSLQGPEHVFELANKKYMELVGERDLLGKTVREALPEIEEQGYLDLLDRVYQTGESYSADEMPVYLESKQGGYTKRFINFVYQATRDEEGEIKGVFVHGIDVTEQLRAREAIRERENWLLVMMDTLPQIVWVARPDGFVESGNRKWVDYLGIDPHRSTGHQWADLLHPEDASRTVRQWQHCIETGEPFEIECRMRRHDGEHLWFLSRALPVRDHHGHVVKWFGTCTDIQDWRRMRQVAEEANRLKDEFLATLSHELRTPLNAMLGWAQLLRAGSLDEEMSGKALEIIERSAHTQGRLIEDILDVSRIASGKIRLYLKPLRLVEIVESAVESTRPAAAEKDIRFSLELLPYGGLVSGDMLRMQQIFWNLLNNAIKFTPPGGCIEIELHEVEHHVEVRVRDTGHGIAPEFLPHVFDRFRQADSSSTRDNGGLGLGLAIVRQLVEIQGGTIEARSEGVDKGATFVARFPLLAPVEAEIPVESPFNKASAPKVGPPQTAVNTTGDRVAGTEPKSEAPLDGLHILVVDDEVDSRIMLRTVLARGGAYVTMAASVNDAMVAIEVERPDIVLSDIAMPGEDGYSLIRRLRRIESERGLQELPAIAVTAFAHEMDKAQALNYGYQHHISKPIQPRELVALVARLGRGE